MHRRLLILFVSLSAAVSTADVMPCRYVSWPVMLGATWTMRFTVGGTDADKRSSTIVSTRQELVVDVSGDSFVEEIRSETTSVDIPGLKAGDIKPEVYQVAYRCSERGPVQNGDRPDPRTRVVYEGPEVLGTLAQGVEWDSSYTMSQIGKVPTHSRVVALEKVAVPAGTFDAWRIEFQSGYQTSPPRAMISTTTGTKWYAPNVGLVRMEEKTVTKIPELKKNNESVSDIKAELVSYKIPSEAEQRVLTAGPSETDDPAELQRRCYGGKAADCFKLAGFYREGKNVETDHRLALDLNEKACNGDYLPACNDLAVYFLWGNLVPKDVSKAAALFKKACDGGAAPGCANLGQRYEKGEGVEQNLERAIKLYKSSCDQNAAVGCFYLGAATVSGTGVAKDPSLAASLFEKACNGRQAEACSRLADMLERGEGIAQDHEHSRKVEDQACDAGWAPDCYKLAQRFEPVAPGVSKEGEHAAAYYFVGCTYGHAPSCTSLGRLLEAGRGVQRDVPFAAKLFNKACDWHDANGCYRLGVLYERGSGVKRDRDRARILYQSACDAKLPEGCAAVDRLGR
jgi:TPR repeat protein